MSLRTAFAAGCAAVAVAAAQAAPQGGQIVAGTGRINVDEAITEILQSSERLAIDWDGFDIAGHETVRFVQPSTEAIALNRIVGGGATEIFGRLEANGRVALINSRGILFADSATVDVGALIASGLELDPLDIAAAEWQLAAMSGDAGFVVNRGLIEAATSATLVGRQVGNGADALIAADVIQLVGADAAVLTFDDTGLIGVAVSRPVAVNPDGLAAAVSNAGQLSGTRILLQAEVAGDVFANAVNNTGLIQARGIDTAGGVIRLIGAGADVATSGTLDASSATLAGGFVELRGDTSYVSGDVDARGATGGEIRLGGSHVALLGDAALDVSGRAGGGTLRIGGAGTGSLYVGADVRLAADAGDVGDGGEVTVTADGALRFFGRVDARGGAAGGDGGHVTTAAGSVVAAGRVDTRAPRGAAGVYQIRSAALQVVDDAGTADDTNPFPSAPAVGRLGAASLAADLAAGNVTVTASGAVGTLTVAADVDLDGSNGNTLTLLAGGDVAFGNAVEIGDADGASADATGIVVRADGNVSLQPGSRIASGGGAISLSGVDVDNLGTVDAGAGAITIDTGRGGRASDSRLGNLTSSTVTQVAGGSGDDVFRLTGSIPGGMTLDGGAGSNRLATAVANQTFTLGAAPTQFALPGSTFGNIQRVDAAGNGNVLLGGGFDRVFSAPAAGRVAANGVQFDGFAEVVGGGNDVLAATGGAFALTGSAGEVQHRDVLFRGLGRVDAGGGSLAGSAGDDDFTANGNPGELLAAAIEFTGLALVTGAGGRDTLTSTETGALIALAGPGAVDYAGMELRELAAVAADQGILLGSAAVDTFTLDSTGRLLTAGLGFDGLAEVRGGGSGSGDVLTGDADDGFFQLTGTDGFAYGGITFRGLDRVAAGNGLNTLAGTADDDVFRIVDAGTVAAHDIRFENITLVAAGDGTDRVIGSGANEIFEAPAANRLSTGQLVFTDVEHLDAGAASTGDLLLGTAGDDRFELAGSRSLTFAGILFENLDRIDGAGGSNTLLGTAGADRVEVSGPRALGSADLAFTAIDTVIGNGGDDLLIAGSGDDTFALGAAAGELTHRDILFRDWRRIDGGAGHDTVIGRGAVDHWHLGVDHSVDVHGLTFANVESADGNGGEDRVFAAAGGSDFLLDGDARVRAGGVTFDGMTGGITGGAGDDTFRVTSAFTGSYRIDGGAGSNRLIGHAGDDTFALSGEPMRIRYGSADFTGIGSVDGGGGVNTLDGTTGDDALTLLGPGALEADGTTFARLSRAHLGSGTDRLTAATGGSDFTVTGAGTVAAAGMAFSGLERLQGGPGDDRFVLEAGAMLAAGIGGGGGADRLAAYGEALDWHVTRAGNRVGDTAFDGIETLADFSSGHLGLTSDFDLTFNDGPWIGFSGGDVVQFDFRSVPSMTVRAGAVTGSGLVARDLTIEAAGDIVLDTEVDTLRAVSGGNIEINQTDGIELLELVTRGGDVRVSTDGDQIVTRIHTGTGGVTLRSALGRLLVADAAAGSVQISAGPIELDALLAIGTAENPFYLDSDAAPRISALEFVSPLLAPGTPQPITQGRRITSLAEAIAASGLRSAVQPYAIDLVRIDPAIFTALLPFSLGSEPIAPPPADPQD